MPPRIVILDTNFLLIPFQFKINVMSELEYLLDFSHRYVISSNTVKELKKLGASAGKEGAGARVALKVLESYEGKIDIIQDERHVDDWIVDYSKETGAIVCTNDSKLRKRLKAFKAKVITMKSKSRLGYV
jgi:rRNA-processing protein FCF1